MIGNKEKLQMVLPFIFILLALIIVKVLLINPFEPPLLPVEKRLLDFVPDKIDIRGEITPAITHDIESPFGIAKKDFPAVPLSALIPQGTQMQTEAEKTHELKVTMIITGQKKGNMAIVNGLVLKEGDIVSSMKLTKIEKNRVLVRHILKTNEARWLYLEEK